MFIVAWCRDSIEKRLCKPPVRSFKAEKAAFLAERLKAEEDILLHFKVAVFASGKEFPSLLHAVSQKLIGIETPTAYVFGDAFGNLKAVGHQIHRG